MVFKFSYKKCNKCIYNYKTDFFNCCEKPDKYGLKLLKPKRAICFKYKENKAENVGE